MKRKRKEPPIPGERHETVRKQIVSVLEYGEPLSARELSGEVRVSEKEVCTHLAHIRKSTEKSGRSLAVTPARCLKCGFVFEERERLTKPGKCPSCKGTHIEEPRFSIR
jgi:predicted Zn-ribbon and HTH transcriptional regulator